MLDNGPNLLEQFSKNLVQENVDIITFAEDPAYCGKMLYPRQRTLLKLIFLEELDDYDMSVIEEWQSGKGEALLNPKVMERRKRLIDKGLPHFRVVQLVGGRRSSKGFITSICMAYKVYQMVQMDNPSAYYGIDKGKDIYFAIIADSLDQAKAHQFGDVQNTIVECKPLIRDKMIGQPKAESISVYTPFDKRRVATLAASGVRANNDAALASLIVKAMGTNSKTIRGSAAMMFVFDEMAHLVAGESRMSDEQLWQAAIPSLAQFNEDGMVFANSSPYTKTGKFFELFEQAMELDPPVDGEPVYDEHLMLKFPSWELYKDWEKDTKHKFANALILPPDQDPILQQEERANPESFKVEYRGEFAEVIDAFLKPEMVDQMFDPAYTQEALGRVLTPTNGSIAFLRYKGHGDPSSVGANFGIAIGHTEDVEEKDESGGTRTVPHVVFDVIEAFRPGDFSNHTIDWLTVMPEIINWIVSFHPYEWTFDQFDSTMAIEILEREIQERGLPTHAYIKHATEGVNSRRARNFKAALNLGRVHAPHPSSYLNGRGEINFETNPIELGKTELKFLQEKNGRVDKPTIGRIKTKDVADCIMEVTDALIGDSLGMSQGYLNQDAAFGAQGGWAIGRPPTTTFEEFGDWYPRQKGQDVYMPERGRGPRR